MPSLFMAQNFIFVVLLCLTVVEKKNAVVSVLVGDEDSSTICNVRKNVEHEVEKWSDVVHTKRSFGSSLYSIKTKQKPDIYGDTVFPAMLWLCTKAE